MHKPLAIDLYAGLGGWSEGLLAEGFRVIGFDIERHEYWMPEIDEDGDGSKGTKPVEKRGWTQGCAVSLGMEGATAKPRTRLVKYPAQLVLQDVLTLHGRQFRDAALIVASPPCQEYSYMAMPWSRAKAIAAEYRSGVRDVKKLTALFDACFRIQREACEAAGHHIPLIVENVRGAIPWVGRSRWNFGSFHLWGDVPALMPMTARAQKFNPDGTDHPPGSWFAIADSKERGAMKNPGFRFDGSGRSFQSESVDRHIKNSGGSWFNVAHNTESGCGRNPVHELAGLGLKGSAGYERDHPAAFGWKKPGTSSHSTARKAASAAIAKIPFPLAQYIARTFKPQVMGTARTHELEVVQ